MFNTSHVAEVIHEAHHFGFTVKETTFDWGTIKASRDKYITRLNAIYESGLESSKVTRINGYASFIDSNTIKVGDQILKSNHILIATGGTPKKLGVPGDDLAIDSNGFFELEKQPKKVAVVGAGYIGVELAGVFNGLGTSVSLFVRRNTALRSFDSMLSTNLDAAMKKSGLNIAITAVYIHIFQ
jgi:glutathione reductase (NADPH)